MTSPADCRRHVFKDITQATEIWIKGNSFSVANLVKNETLAKLFEGGQLVIARLAPQDYHRFHSPVSGTLSEFTSIDGVFYTVNPVAVRQPTVNVYTENRRVVTTIQSPEFGTVLFIAIGATMVGSIVMTARESSPIHKGDELGYFAFGGSTCLVLFQKDKVKFDADLILNSIKPIETLVKMGEKLGEAAL